MRAATGQLYGELPQVSSSVYCMDPSFRRRARPLCNKVWMACGRPWHPAELQPSMHSNVTACRQQQGTGSSTAGVHKQQPTCIIAFSRVRGIMHSSALSCTMGCMGNRSIAATTASTPLSLATRHWLACRSNHSLGRVQQHVPQALSKLQLQVAACLM